MCLCNSCGYAQNVCLNDRSGIQVVCPTKFLSFKVSWGDDNHKITRNDMTQAKHNSTRWPVCFNRLFLDAVRLLTCVCVCVSVCEFVYYSILQYLPDSIYSHNDNDNF